MKVKSGKCNAWATNLATYLESILFFLRKVLKTKESVLIELFKKEMIVKVKLMDNTCKYVYLMNVWNIYLKDAFSGCQILPCSHKVHRECAIAMIQNGV